ncbi:MAG: glycine--tRNA ligase subunit beta [Rhodobacteraceae bacterium]|nr:glycine--tRNA ligase subunit beta [Paracoccaceae bacterium]
MPDLLIELFSEEIPARMQARAADDLRKRVTDGLVEAGLTYAGAAGFATPRRLALAIEGLTGESPSLREERKGPRVDAPEKAIDGFLRGAGVSRDALEVRDEKKGQVYYATITKPGRPAPEIVAEVLEQVIRTFPWPKSMRWGAGSLRWVRPLHSILCILTDEAGEAHVVPMEVDGIRAGDTTEGHRFMAPGRFSVTGFEDYAAKLKRAHVILDAGERAAHIWHEASNQAFAAGLELVEDNGLLAEVAGLVEWPVVLLGQIDAEFLDLPPEVLQTSMKEHQKFFSVRNPKTGRIERFVTVANRETADHGATILAGNQKVLSARLSDAKFFWENDLRTVRDKGLEGMGAGLAQVTFHNKLGSQADRVARIEALAREIAPMVGAKPDLAAEAARVCKADLQSEMVGEFPELQGLMGRYYAQAAGHDDGVPEACEEHYSPLGPSDEVPSRLVSVTVALADKIDTLTGFWAIDEKPTGSKDPYALRRAALGVIRLVVENEVRINLHKVIQDRIAAPHVVHDLLQFLSRRLEQVLRADGVRYDVIEACFNTRGKVLKDAQKEALELDAPDILDRPFGEYDLFLVAERAKALSSFLKTEEGENLLQGFKRANNILTQAEEKDGVEYSFGADPKFAEDPTETALFDALQAAEAKIATANETEDFTAAMAAMASLRAPLDDFFEAVQINSESQVLRRNRLNLLFTIRKICLQAADLTRLEG